MIYTTARTGAYRVIKVTDVVETAAHLLELREAFQRFVHQGELHFLLDLSGIPFIDFRLLTIVRDTYEVLSILGGSIGIVTPDTSVAQTIRHAGVSEFARIFKSRDETGTIPRMVDSSRDHTEMSQVADRGFYSVSSSGLYRILSVGTVVSTIGQIDILQKDIDLLIRQGDIRFVFDFKDNDIINSVLIGVVASVYGRVSKLGGDVTVLTESRTVRTLLQDTHLNRVVTVFPSQDIFFEQKRLAGEDLSPTTVLIATSDNEVRVSLHEQVERLGYTIVAASDAAGAVAQAVRAKPDLILLDAELEGEDGYAAAKEVKQHRWGDYVPVILITRRGDEDARFKALACEADDCIEKPVLEADLIFRIRTHLRLRGIVTRNQRRG